MQLDLPGLTAFAAEITIPSKEEGLVKFARLYGTQTYLLQEIARGIEDDIHDFVIVKGRQEGITTIMDSLRLWWPQVHPGTQGMFVSNSDENRDFRRDVCLEMLASLPKAFRLPVRINNRNLLAWPLPNGSRLMFEAAGARADSDLGRSRGLNFLDADEVGLWPSEHDIEALRASLSSRYPRRLYLWNGTGKGHNIFKTMWDTARKAATQRAIFVSWWRHELFAVPQSARAIWDLYGQDRMTTDERQWIDEVQRAYDVEITVEQLVWYRWKLDEEFYGDEAMRAQEFPCIPEDAFQAFGDKFIPASEIQRLRLALRAAPEPSAYRYELARHVDESQMLPADPAQAPLLVWEEPERDGVYIVAGHPWGSSSPKATTWVAQVYRAWPDQLVQCAEYTADSGTAYGFAWLLLYLAGAYNVYAPPYIIVETNAVGYAVEKEIQLLTQHGYGISETGRTKGLQDFFGSFRHYFYTRPDKITWRTPPIDWKTTGDIRPYLLHSLSDTVIRRNLIIRSPRLIDALAALRRGESGNNDQIVGGAGVSDAHAVCSALVVKCWQDFAMNELRAYIAPREPAKAGPKRVEDLLVSTYMQRLTTTGRAR